MSARPAFAGGPNIAVKVPPHEFDAVVAFYRDVLGLAELADKQPHICFAFGANQLWIDRVPGMSQSELWLEIRTDDGEAARNYLRESGVARRDEIEPLPQGSDGFWIASPGNIIHLVSPGHPTGV